MTVFAALLLCVTGAACAAAASEAMAQEQHYQVLQDDGSDPLGPERRLVGRDSSESVDAVFFGLMSIAAGLSVMLVIFVWHTSPRRRLRLSRGLAWGGRDARAVAGEEPVAAESGPAGASTGDPGGETGESEGSAV